MRKDEQETILLTDEASDEWEIMTFNAKLQSRLADFAEKCPDRCRKVEIFPSADRQETYIVSKRCVRITLNAPLSESDRARRAEMLKNNLAKKKGETNV